MAGKRKKTRASTRKNKPKKPSSSGVRRVEMAGMNALDMGGTAEGGPRRRRRRTGV